jgi:hypothetical protein
MQILESTMIGLRSARITMRRSGSLTEITLFPMLHVAEASFFRAVYEDAYQHDVILVEGVSGPLAKRLTRSYRWMAASPRLGLALQGSAKPARTGSARIVLADLSAEEFGAAWSKIPLWVRVFVHVASRLMGLQRRWFVTRETLAKRLEMDDLTPDDELMESPEIAALNHAILHARDARLLEHLERELSENPTEGRRVAVIYGASHMRAVVRRLTRLGYYASGTEWMTVFRL